MTGEESGSGLQVLGVGFGRTGTLSTMTALNRLGLPCYHMTEVLKKRGHLDFWLRVADSEPGVQHAWQEVFSGYRATVDNPAAVVWRELLEANPDAKVLLTLHPKGPDAWFDSTRATIYRPQLRWEPKFLGWFVPSVRKLNLMAKRLIWDRFHRGTMSSREEARERYLEHEREVRETVPPEQLLVFKATEGWEPLCDFLGLDVPDEPFPRVNERQQMRRTMNGMFLVAYALVTAIAALATFAVWFWTR